MLGYLDYTRMFRLIPQTAVFRYMKTMVQLGLMLGPRWNFAKVAIKLIYGGFIVSRIIPIYFDVPAVMFMQMSLLGNISSTIMVSNQHDIDLFLMWYLLTAY